MQIFLLKLSLILFSSTETALPWSWIPLDAVADIVDDKERNLDDLAYASDTE